MIRLIIIPWNFPSSSELMEHLIESLKEDTRVNEVRIFAVYKIIKHIQRYNVGPRLIQKDSKQSSSTGWGLKDCFENNF